MRRLPLTRCRLPLRWCCRALPCAHWQCLCSTAWRAGGPAFALAAPLERCAGDTASHRCGGLPRAARLLAQALDHRIAALHKQSGRVGSGRVCCHGQRWLPCRRLAMVASRRWRLPLCRQPCCLCTAFADKSVHRNSCA
ncbi:hypothetical protein B296_00009110 [Ensete ventricosum]|uniref:Uncharacterized protein n=1 Tax=Ensete ventricosum TaxID=4639 RepID=A0A427B5V5_ENSVE|nr:hypothetical protein B296_00009110 [Ensete ventricosum]